MRRWFAAVIERRRIDSPAAVSLGLEVEGDGGGLAAIDQGLCLGPHRQRDARNDKDCSHQDSGANAFSDGLSIGRRRKRYSASASCSVASSAEALMPRLRRCRAKSSV